jgi:hypothetical protein
LALSVIFPWIDALEKTTVVVSCPYLIDFGTGVIRHATAAYKKGVTAIGYRQGYFLVRRTHTTGGPVPGPMQLS